MNAQDPRAVARHASAVPSERNPADCGTLLLATDPATTLCLACGFCCDGTLHTNTVLLPGEVDAAAAAGLVVEVVGEGPAFRQPCAMFGAAQTKAGRCSIYEDRPLVCRRYECALLKRLLARETTLEQALRVVGVAHQQLAAWRSRAPSATSFMHWLKAIEADERAGQGDARSTDALLADPDASNHAVALIMYLTKYFGEAGAAPEGRFDISALVW